MTLAIFKSPVQPKASTTPSTAPLTIGASKEAFEKKLGALRVATGRPERFISLCACALHDRPFAVVYERSDAARPFTITGIYRDGEGKDAASGAARVSGSKTLPASAVDTTGWRCPHCQAGGRNIACQNCGATVCGGRTRAYHGTAEVFECRSSCGARGTLQDAKSVKGIEEVRKAAPGLRSAPPRNRLPSPIRDALRLGPPMGEHRLK